jgi:hypothetical protein
MMSGENTHDDTVRCALHAQADRREIVARRGVWMNKWMNKMNDLTGEGYMTGIAPADLLAALAHTAEDVGAAAKAVIALGDDIPEGAEGEWTPAEILGHICDGARVWGGRMRRVAREEKPKLEAFDESMALRIAGYRWKRLEPLLAEFRIVSDDTLAFLRGLTPGDWTRVGRHPTLGRVSLGDLARIEMEHERDHARQLREATARERLE